MYLLCFKFSKNHTEKGHDSQILYPGRIYYNFLPSTKFEGECREYLRHLTVKLRT